MIHYKIAFVVKCLVYKLKYCNIVLAGSANSSGTRTHININIAEIVLAVQKYCRLRVDIILLDL